VLVHCWRGGMRSEAIAWLLDLYCFKVCLLKGGYKTFRNYVLEVFSRRYKMNLLSGYTGAGKTSLLHALRAHGKTIIDLEAIAHHKGSAFGAINQPRQPSQEMFENTLALELTKHEHNSVIWVEDESQRIGTVLIPPAFWEQMQHSQVFFLDTSFEARLARIMTEYGNLDKNELVAAIQRIQKRLGGMNTKMAILHINENNIPETFKILLHYYDRCYQKSLHTRSTPVVSNIEGFQTMAGNSNVELLISRIDEASSLKINKVYE
jgi:tRNA 2-selenouridine synthase